jgi:hypothetical protein
MRARVRRRLYCERRSGHNRRRSIIIGGESLCDPRTFVARRGDLRRAEDHFRRQRSVWPDGQLRVRNNGTMLGQRAWDWWKLYTPVRTRPASNTDDRPEPPP